MLNSIKTSFARHIQIMTLVSNQLAAAIASTAEVVVEAIESGNKVMVMGNGGSAADAQHFVAELVGRFKADRQALPAISLVDNVSTLTIIHILCELIEKQLFHPGAKNEPSRCRTVGSEAF